MRSAGVIAVGMLCVGLSAAAQTPAGTTAQTSKVSGQTTTMTVTGCLQRTDQRPGSDAVRSGGEPGSSSGASTRGVRNDAEQYTLTNVSNRAISTNASSSNPSSIATESAYLLEGQRDDLRAHVGHEVEITAMQIATPATNNQGDMRAAPTQSPERSANPDTSRSTDTSGANGVPKITSLMVQSVRMLSTTCSPRP